MATILCIDDDPGILQVQEALLGSRYRVLTARDGPTGIALTRQHSIDAVVLDFHMPGMDGDQVAQILMKERLKWFADAVLQKGDGRTSLLSAIQKLLDAPPRARNYRLPTIFDFGGTPCRKAT